MRAKLSGLKLQGTIVRITRRKQKKIIKPKERSLSRNNKGKIKKRWCISKNNQKLKLMLNCLNHKWKSSHQILKIKKRTLIQIFSKLFKLINKVKQVKRKNKIARKSEMIRARVTMIKMILLIQYNNNNKAP